MNHKLFALTLLITASLTGCAVRPPIAGRADPYSRNQVNFADPDLANKTAVAPPMTERKNGLLYVTVPVRSSVNRDFHVDYRITFFNENGVPIEGPTLWTSGPTLTANTPSYIQFNSITANAADFQLDLRYAQ
ncbi:MAG TPA: DUF1425 domain-containing protein [Tepidisphaeraceae bacterium]|nr:DUF1425 domain-containing protein [Tepidisphaeraceae bacterium]